MNARSLYRWPSKTRSNSPVAWRNALCGCLLLAGCALVGPTRARADAFAMVPIGAPVYNDLNAVARAGWLSAPVNTTHALTRYELSLETAKAIFAVTAHQKADPNWSRTAPRSALRSLKGLIVEFRTELKQLNLDVVATTAQIDQILTRPVDITRGSAPMALSNAPLTRRPEMNSLAGASALNSGRVTAVATSRLARSSTVLSPLARPDIAPSRLAGQKIDIPLSQSLRVETALLALRRESFDPFGDRALASRPLTARQLQDSVVPLGMGAGAAYDVTDWLTLRANYAKRTAGDDRRTFANDLAPGTTAERTVGGSVDINWRGSVTLTSGIARVSADGADATSGTRFEGGVGLSAWQNRVLLSANLSRLVPEDSYALEPHTAARFGVGVDVTERLSLKLLYQGMFGAPDQNHVAGGISIRW